MKKSITITSIMLANLLIVVSAAHALPTVYLLKDQLTVSNEVWFGSEIEKTDSFSYQYSGPSWQGDGFNEVNSQIKQRIYREIDGETEWAEDLSVAQFQYDYERFQDNSHFFRGSTAAGYFDNSQGWPVEEITARGEASVDLYWRFSVDGEGAEMWANIIPEGNPVQTDLVLYDETENLILADYHRSGPDNIGKTGDVELLDSHIYRIWLHTWASDIGGGGDPMSSFEMAFYNTEFAVPVPSVALLLVTGFVGLIRFNRKK